MKYILPVICNIMGFITEKIKRILFISLGTIFLGIGSIGVILPILPTTPFMLLSAACYIRGSPRIYQWLISNRVFGEFIGNYVKGKGIKRRQKWIAIFSTWLMISVTIIFFLDEVLLRILLLVIAGAVSAHILNLPTFND